MISVVHFIPRGRLAEQPAQYELAPEEMEELVAKHEAMQLESNLDTNDIDEHDVEDDSEDSDDEAAAIDTLAKHVDIDGEDNNNDDDDDEKMADDDIVDGAENTDEPLEINADDATANAFLSELGMDKYDDEPEGAELFLGGQKLTVHSSNTEDPFITVPDDDDNDSDDDDTTIQPTDHCLLVGRTEDDQSAMELMIFDSETGNLFVHHDFQLPSFPLCAQYLDCDPRDTSNIGASLLAVGTMLPHIEIWNLNVMDALEPVCVLGGVDDTPQSDSLSSKSKKSKRKSLEPRRKAGSHSDAVLCMSWHPAHRERLASGSADETVKLWDITTQQCTLTLDHHKHKPQPAPVKAKSKKSKKNGSADDDESWFAEAAELNTSHKVQSIDWNPSEPSLLLTGAYDKSVHLIDVRVSQTGGSGSRVWMVDSDVESVRWHPSSSFAYLFLVASESGLVTAFDARKPIEPVFRLNAHGEACTTAAFNPIIPTLFLTASNDKTVKLWDITITDTDSITPTLVSSKEMKVGQVWSAGWARDTSSLLACGGDKGKVAVWDIRENSEAMKRWGAEQRWQALPAAEEAPSRQEKRAARSKARLGINANNAEHEEASEGHDSDIDASDED